MSNRIDYNAYCIITNRVSNLGGAQLYTLRRAKYLTNRGIPVKIIVTENNNFILEEEFKNIPILILKELACLYSIFDSDKLNVITKKVREFLQFDTGRKFIIETHSPQLSICGEILASYLQCKHISYFLSETNINSFLFSPFLEYFYWKLERGELYGISNISLKLIFKNAFDNRYNNYVNIPFDESEIPTTTFPKFFENVPTNVIRLGTVSRLSKPYILDLLNSARSLSKKLSDKHIILYIVGDDADKSILKKLKRRYGSEYNNLTILFPGYVTPLGKDFFNSLDVFIGMGTSAVNSISQKCATITIDPITNKATGLLGLTNNNFAYSERGTFYEIEDLMEMLITDKSLLKQSQVGGFRLFQEQFSMGPNMVKLDSFIFNSNPEKVYWKFQINALALIKRKYVYLILTSEAFKLIFSYFRSVLRLLRP